MTRFAKRGFENRKLDEPTPWTEMKQFKTGAGGKTRFNQQKGANNKAKWKQQRGEDRRLKRKEERESAKVCFNCRGNGHKVSECPFISDSSQRSSCYKCGSTEHTAFLCTAKVPKGSFPYAQCFICGEQGHISKQCPDNPRGLYPKGGCCKQCGSVEHLKRDCPDFQKKKGVSDVTADMLESGVSADAQMIPAPPADDDDDKDRKKKIKVVKF